MTRTVRDRRGTALDIRVNRGTDNSEAFTIKDPAGDAVNITGDTVVLTVRKDFGGERVFSIENTTHTTPASGITTFDIARTYIDDEARSQVVEHWVYDVRWYDASTGDENVQYYGRFEVWPVSTDPGVSS